MLKFLVAAWDENRLANAEDTGKLYLCVTSIGSLDDITLRVLKTPEEVDLIAVEDARHSTKLLNHFETKMPMTSYHELNKTEKARYLMEQMRQGVSIASAMDAGTPGILDPGEELVRQCHETGIEATSLPGPAVCMTALVLSGLLAGRFCSEAFLSADKKDRQWILEELKREIRTIIVYEAPHRLARMLGELLETLGSRSITICREFTKKYEEAYRMVFEDALRLYEIQGSKGECVIVIEGKRIADIQNKQVRSWGEVPTEKHMATYEGQGIERKGVMRLMARNRGISKRDVYQYLMNRKESQGLKFV